MTENLTIFNKINEDIKTAMKDGNTIKRNCLRAVISEIKNQTVNAGKPITDDVCMNVLKKSAKQHNDSIENFRLGNRLDLIEQEQIELDYINAYLPRMYSESETFALISDIMNEMDFTDEKKNMGQIMKILKSNKSVDGKVAAKCLNQILK